MSSAKINDCRAFLRRVYDISYISDLHSPFLSDELPGRGTATVTDLRLDLALVKATIRRVLSFDHLTETINAVYSDDPEAVFSIVELLSQSLRCDRGRAMMALEHCKTMTHDGLCGFEPRNPPERRLSEWMEFAVGILAEEFEGKGWI